MLVDDDDYRWSGDRLGSDFRFGYLCVVVLYLMSQCLVNIIIIIIIIIPWRIE